MRTRYFGTHTSAYPHTISIAINGVDVLRHAQVLGMDQSRTTHDTIMENLSD